MFELENNGQTPLGPEQLRRFAKNKGFDLSWSDALAALDKIRRPWQPISAPYVAGVSGNQTGAPYASGASGNQSAREAWHFRTDLKFIDTWPVRSYPSYDAPQIAVLKAGEPFYVRDFRTNRDGDWLELLRLNHDPFGWASRMHGDVEALTRVGAAQPVRVVEPPPPFVVSPAALPSSAEVRGAAPANRRAAAEEVMARHDGAAELPVDLAIDLEALESTESLPSAETASVTQTLVREMNRRTSFMHTEFANPRMQSCWLSTFFQSLWHSRVFHAAFEQLVRPLSQGKPGTALWALQQTWKLYEEVSAETTPKSTPSRWASPASRWIPPTDRSSGGVPVSALVQAWGRGYGDCAEAFGALQGASDLQALASLFALIPVQWERRLPMSDDIWKYVKFMDVAKVPLLAVDLVFPVLSKDEVLKLAQGFAPAASAAADIGEGHRLISVICYMEACRHYVVFCRRLSNADAWLFFNDIPGLTRGALKELDGWDSVARACARYMCCPRVLLYENSTAAEEAVAEAASEKRSCTQM